MPSDLRASPAMNIKNINREYRSRSWVNTTNYRNVPRESRPINSYFDDRQWQVQTFHDGANKKLRISPYTVTWVVQPGLLWDGTDMQAGNPFGFNLAYQQSGFAAAMAGYQDRMVLELLGKISDQKANLAMAYAEAHKTSEQILGTARRVSDAYRHFKRGNLSAVAKTLNIPYFPKRNGLGVHKTWLEYKYGWMPLLMDVKGTAELFAQHVVGRPLRFSVQKRQTVSFNWSEMTPYTAWGGGLTAHYFRYLTGTYNLRCKIECEVTNPHSSALQQMGLTNPALLAWELIPFSFVFDWFISVGDYLKGLSSLHGISVRRAMRSNINDLVFTFVQPQTVNVGRPDGYDYFQGAKRNMTHQRAYGRGSLTVDPWALSPPVNDNLGFTKLVTSLALLKSVHR